MVKESQLHKGGKRFAPHYPDSSLIPDSDNGRDIGSSTREYKDLYLDGTANIDSLSADIATMGAYTVSGHILGQRDGIWSIGASGSQIKNLYVGDTAYIDSLRMEYDGRMLHANAPNASGLGSFYISGGTSPQMFVYVSGAAAHVWASHTLGVG